MNTGHRPTLFYHFIYKCITIVIQELYVVLEIEFRLTACKASTLLLYSLYSLDLSSRSSQCSQTAI